MKAAVMRANNAPLEIEDIQIDDPGPREVLVKTSASGICHSDLHVIEGNLPVPPPCVLGHEPAGIVEAVGEGVTDFAPGDHVIGWRAPRKPSGERLSDAIYVRLTSRDRDALAREARKRGLTASEIELQGLAFRAFQHIDEVLTMEYLLGPLLGEIVGMGILWRVAEMLQHKN